MSKASEAIWGTLDQFTKGYLECALWSSVDDKGEPLDKKSGVHDFCTAALRLARKDCAAFQRDNACALDEYCEARAVPHGESAMAYAGHDFWLTRCGHGAGFWDRGLGAVGDALTAAAEAYGDAHVWRGKRGRSLEITAG